MFIALLKRKQAKFREAQYLAGITASMVANMGGKTSQKSWSPWDFVPDPKDTELREKLKQHIVAVFNIAVAMTTQDMDEIREKVIARLKAAGHADVEEIFEEAFPKWKREEMKHGSNSRNTDR